MPPKPPALDIDNAVRCYLTGKGAQPLAHALGVSDSYLRKRLQAAGVQLRGRAEALRLRLERVGPNGRKALTKKANAALRGKPRDPELSHKLAGIWAHKKQVTGSMMGSFEHELGDMLSNRGLHPIPQQPVLGYNVDLGIAPIAVEVHVGAGHPLSDAIKRKRTKKIIECGWFVLYVWITNAHALTEHAADQIITLHQRAKRNPSALRKYGVIRGSGEPAPFPRIGSVGGPFRADLD